VPAAGGNGSLIIAAGHYRNGILLSAITADAVLALLHGQETDDAWTPFRPSRFQQAPTGGHGKTST
jgi:glycine oxidase